LLEDPSDPDRFQIIGMSGAARVLLVVHVERGPRERITNARLATASEEPHDIQGP
jgi:uncharacterized DUF497 family protein